jgi:hypothetical protein
MSPSWGLQALAEAPMMFETLLAAILVMSNADQIAAASLPVTLSTGQTSTLPLAPYAADAVAEGRAPRLVVTVSGYRPGADPVDFVVSLLCGEGEKVLGRFAIMPRMSFSAAEPARAQHFGLSAPNTPECRAAHAATVRLEPAAGQGRDASITISGIGWQ